VAAHPVQENLLEALIFVARTEIRVRIEEMSNRPGIIARAVANQIHFVEVLNCPDTLPIILL
jgi:hypothetical protein